MHHDYPHYAANGPCTCGCADCWVAAGNRCSCTGCAHDTDCNPAEGHTMAPTVTGKRT
jgi:hypothetical protein